MLAVGPYDLRRTFGGDRRSRSGRSWAASQKGLDHHAIACELVIAPKTVEKHIEHILSKLEVHSRAQAIALALQDEPTEPPVLADVTHLEDIKRRDAMSG